MKKIIFLFVFVIIAGLLYLTHQSASIISSQNMLSPSSVVALQEKRAPYPKNFAPVPESDTYYARIILDPSREFESIMIFLGQNQLARFKKNVVTGEMYDIEGKIPDEQMDFKIAGSGDYGTLEFRNGKLHSYYKEFYKTGEKKKEAYYYYGRLMESTDYFIDGTVRMQQDNNDALIIEGKQDVGEGKVFYRNGNVRYEWSFTIRGKGGYDRSYDQEGGLRAERVYDETGKMIKEYYR